MLNEIGLRISSQLGAPKELLAPAPGFHTRDFLTSGHRLATIFPRHHPSGVDIKITYSLDTSTTEKDILNRAGKIKILSTQEGNKLNTLRKKAQHLYDLCEDILEDKEHIRDTSQGEEIIQLAKTTRDAVLRGTLSLAELKKVHADLFVKLDENDERAILARKYRL